MRAPTLPARRRRTRHPDDLATLLARAGRGDRQAFAQVYDATAPRVHHLVLCVVGDPDRAAKVTREVYLEAWATSGRVDPGVAPLTWLLTLAHRMARAAAGE